MMISGRVGLGVSCMSYGESFKIALTADEEVCRESRKLVDLIEANIMNEVERLRDVPVPVGGSEATILESKKNK